MLVKERDTDADWRELGAKQPFWGVLSNPQFRSESLTPDVLEAFYDSGRGDIGVTIKRFERLTGAPAAPRRALDFGCGAGRLSEAMALHAQAVTALDISPGMLAAARANSAGKVRYVDRLPDETFDWINSIIVFQHIPPHRGLGLLKDLLARLEPGGLLSFQITVWRDEPYLNVFGRIRRRLQQLKHKIVHPVGVMTMYDYDFSQVVRLLHKAGVEQMELEATDHGGHHGVMIYARKSGGLQDEAQP